MSPVFAQDPVITIFGRITPPPGPSQLYGDPIVGLGQLIAVLLNIVFIIFGIVVLMYMIWGALDWVTSEGDDEKLKRARAKITNALLGLLYLVVSLTLFAIITGEVLGILFRTPNGWQLNIPIIEKSTDPNACPGTCRVFGPRARGCRSNERIDDTKICPDITSFSEKCCVPN